MTASIFRLVIAEVCCATRPRGGCSLSLVLQASQCLWLLMGALAGYHGGLEPVLEPLSPSLLSVMLAAFYHICFPVS